MRVGRLNLVERLHGHDTVARRDRDVPGDLLWRGEPRGAVEPAVAQLEPTLGALLLQAAAQLRWRQLDRPVKGPLGKADPSGPPHHDAGQPLERALLVGKRELQGVDRYRRAKDGGGGEALDALVEIRELVA